MNVELQQPKTRSIATLIEENQFRKALDEAQQQWGPYRNWKEPNQLLTAIRVFNGLGLRRRALASRFWLWRKHKSDPAAVYHYVLGTFDRRGPLQALQKIKHFGLLESAPVALRAEWLALQAEIYAQYRDWETATALINQAIELDEQNPRVRMEQVYLAVGQDQYELARQLNTQLMERNHRPAIQYGAHLKTLQHDNAGAIDILQPHLMDIESVSLALQLYRLYYDEGNLQQAEQCVERAKSLLPVGEVSLDEGFSVAAYELAFEKGDLPTAQTALENVKSKFFKKIHKNLAQSDSQHQQKVLDVPFIRQHHMTCAPATLAAICKYWGKEVDHLGVVEDICYDGTPNHAERRWAMEQGWEVREFKLCPETAFALIDKGIPFTLSTVAPQSAHLQALVGYDQRRGIYLIRDPFYPSLQEFLIEDLGEQCRSSGPRCLALFPQSKASLIEGIEFPESDLYDHYYLIIEALEKHDRAQAEKQLQLMEASNPGHRLTLQAKRALSRYNSDTLTELNVVDELLMQFPDDLNLLADKSYILGRLGRYQAQIDFLESEIHKAGAAPHPLLSELLAYQLSADHRQAQRSQSLLAYTLRYQPTNAAALWNLANVFWDKEDYEQAFLFYRLCSMLEDKNEGYINSYFKAARYLKRTDEALERLRHRVEVLGKKSIYPFESLYYALGALSLDEQALAVMEQALQWHPDNSQVIERLVRGYLYNGKTQKSAELFNNNKKKLSEVARLSLAADISRHRSDWAGEISFNEKILQRQPLNYGVIESQAALLGRHEGSEAAIDFLESRLKLNEQDKALLFMKLDWLFERSAQEQAEFCQTIIDIHPGLYDGHLRLARIKMGQHQFDEAQKCAETAYAINPYNVDVSTTLGDIYYHQENLPQAHKLYRSTLEYSVDSDGIFDRLLRCHDAYEEKQKELAYILDQLMQQTSYGNGILEYKEVARNLVKDEELLVFLEKAVEVRPDLWQSWFALFSHLSTMDLLDRALSIANQAIAKFPLLPRLYLGRANIHFVAQNLSGAESDLNEALRQNPHWETAILRLTDVLEAQKRYDEALTFLQKALKFSPTNAILHGCVADLLANNGKQDEAIAHLAQALQLDPHYDWAWDRYRGLVQSTDCPNAAKDLAKSILNDRPHSVTVWRKLVEFEDDLDQRLAYVDQALDHHPKNEDINLAKCRTLFALNKIGAVKELVHHEKWNQHPPVALLAYEAWMEAKYQRYNEAIALMEPITEQFPHYYDAWRLLSEWHKTLGNYDLAMKNVDTCVRLYPHAPQTLTMAAEVYLEAQHHDVDVSDDSIDSFLEKAVVLSPKDQYNCLTWIDFLIEKKRWSELARAKNIVHHDPDNPYYLVRELQAAARQRDRDEALELFSTVIESTDSNDWLYVTSYREMVDAGYKEELRAFLESQLSNPNANSMLGWLWALYCLDFEKKGKAILTYLQPLEQGSDLWLNAMEAIFSSGQYSGTAEIVIKKFKKSLADNGRLWSLVTFHYSRIQNWKKLRHWCEPNWHRDSNEAWAVYLYSYGLRLVGQWKSAYGVNRYAASLPADGYQDRILLWQLAESVLVTGNDLDTDLLARIRFNELSSFEQYSYTLLCTLYTVLEAGGLDHAGLNVINTFKQAKKDYREIANSNVGVRFNRQIRTYLVRQYSGSLGKKLFWTLRLYLSA